MRKYNSVLIVVTFILVVLAFTTSPVSAQGKDVYFVNMNGVELTEQQYNNLASVFSEDTILTMAPGLAEELKNETEFTKVETTKYLKVEYTYENGKVVSTKDTEMTKEEFGKLDEIIELEEKISHRMRPYLIVVHMKLLIKQLH